MKRKWTVAAAALAVVLAGTRCYAISVATFQDTDSYIKEARDIVVAKCLSVPDGAPVAFPDFLYPAEVEVLMTLKGPRKPGRLKIATIYAMKPGAVYLLASEGGLAFETDFLAVPELAVVLLPAKYDLAALKGLGVKEQVKRLFAARLGEVKQWLAVLESERDLLVKGLR
jgi:hypothetical protein